jgi:hypothetical protein
MALQNARFVRKHGLGDVLPYVQAAWLAHTGLMATLRAA